MHSWAAGACGPEQERRAWRVLYAEKSWSVMRRRERDSTLPTAAMSAAEGLVEGSRMRVEECVGEVVGRERIAGRYGVAA